MTGFTAIGEDALGADGGDAFEGIGVSIRIGNATLSVSTPPGIAAESIAVSVGIGTAQMLNLGPPKNTGAAALVLGPG
jgi:hypothetical protein